MKICFVCGEYPPAAHGGIGSFVQTVGRALVASGHQVRVIGLYAGAVPAGDIGGQRPEDDRGVQVWRLAMPRGPAGWIAGRRLLFRRIADWVRQGEVDVIEVPDWQGWAAHWPRLPVPVVTRLHGSFTYFAAEMARPIPRLFRYIEGRSLHRSDFWCSVSRYTARQTQALFRLRSEPSAILPNGVHVPSTPPWSTRRDSKVVFTGTLTEKKGVIALIDAWPHVAQRVPQARLHILGKDGTAPDGGSMAAYLQRRLPRELSDGVRFAGHVSREQVLTELQNARVAVFPSYAEAFALGPLEAMAAGCPTVGTALGSGPELIQDGVDGLTVDPHDPAGMADALVRVLADEAFARTLASKGRDKVAREFSLDATLTANVEFFADCIDRAGARPRWRSSPRIGRALPGPSRQRSA